MHAHKWEKCLKPLNFSLPSEDFFVFKISWLLLIVAVENQNNPILGPIMITKKL